MKFAILNEPCLISIAVVALLASGAPLAAQTASLPAAGAPQSAAHIGTISGTIRATNGKAWPNVAIKFYEDTANFNPANPSEIRVPPKFTVATDQAGRYKAELPAGTYIMKLTSSGQLVCQIRVPIYSGVDTPGDMDFKFFQTKYGDVLKQFDAGDKALADVTKIRDEIDKLQSDLDAAGLRAAADYRQGMASADEDNFFSRFFFLAKLGDTYDAMGAYATAAENYKAALELKPDAIAYSNLANDLAKSGSFDEAEAACEKSVALNPATAAQTYVNLAINLYNAGRFERAIAPAKKSTELDPMSAKGWYVLGASLAGTVQFKQQGEKMVPDIPQGTIEAFQKAISMDSRGTWGKLSQEGVDQLHRMQAGIATKEFAVPIKQ
jgi:tetratricopeptide (TPR) repeat protein